LSLSFLFRKFDLRLGCGFDLRDLLDLDFLVDLLVDALLDFLLFFGGLRLGGMMTKSH
jgi:hypothetical protein